MTFRKIFMVEVYSNEGDLVERRYAANMRTAERIARENKEHKDGIIIRLLGKDEHDFVNPDWVERYR